MIMISRRSWITVVVLAALTGSALIPVAPLLLRDRLPDPVATHWDLGGAPDGSSSFPLFLAFSAGLWLLFCALAVLVSTGWEQRTVRARAGAILGGGIGLTSGVVALTLRANLDVPTWHEARPVGWGLIALLLLGMLATGAVGWLIGNLGLDRPGPAAGPVPELELAAGERPVWIGYVRNRWLVVIGVAMAALGSVAALLALLLPEPLTPGRPIGVTLIPMTLAGLAVLAMSSITVTVDKRGLGVVFGPFGRLRRHIALSRIVSAWAEDRSPAQAGGWGYRGLTGNTTVMLRGGQCLVVRYGSGGEFAVSVDDADHGAALLNSLRERAA
jgi:hypothetical protein